MEGRSLDVVRLLVEAWPDSVREKDGEGFFPLHRACDGGCMDDVIHLLIESWPQAVQIVTNEGGFPLHYACKGKTSLTIIRLLVRAWPDGVRFPDETGWLPFHSALMSGCKDDVIEFLVHSWPKSCRIATNQGKLPENLVVMEHRIRAWPESIQILCQYVNDMTGNKNNGEDQDSDMEHHEYDYFGHGGGGSAERRFYARGPSQCDSLPLDLARAWGRKPSPELIRLLTNNMLPLHFLCTHAAKVLSPQIMGTMEYLMSVFPDHPKLFYHGMLPFHCACRAGASRFLLKWWWERFPDIVQVIATDTGDTSLHCYLSSPQAAVKWYLLAVQFLVEKYPCYLFMWLLSIKHLWTYCSFWRVEIQRFCCIAAVSMRFLILFSPCQRTKLGENKHWPTFDEFDI